MPTAWLDGKGWKCLEKMRDGEQGEVPSKGGKMEWMEVVANHVISCSSSASIIGTCGEESLDVE